MICCNCVSRATLKKYVQDTGSQAVCGFCKSTNTCVSDSDLSNYMLEMVEKVLVPEDSLSALDRGMIESGSSEPAIFELWEFFEDFSEFACDKFMEQFVNSLSSDVNENGYTVLYALDDGTLHENNSFDPRWKDFVVSIGNRHRFFNRTAKTFLDDLFDVLLSQGGLDTSVVIPVDPSVSIFRARIASDTATLKKIQSSPGSDLGPVPAELASNQRMSPEGVSVFYGALDRTTCLSEISPLVGDTVVSGEFRVRREHKLLDLNKLVNFEPDVDVFHENYIQHMHAAAFFRELVFQMSRPARGGYRNQYLSTQVIFEYLAVKFGKQIDGIMYLSVQQDKTGECVALFPKASGVSSHGCCKLGDVDNTSSGELSESLCFVQDSLRFHRVRGVSYRQQEYDTDSVFTTSDEILAVVGDRF